jgi:uncharacterized Zn-binding protein involved in type VI secretion
MVGDICRTNDIVVGRCEASAVGHPRDFVGTWTSGSNDVLSNHLSVVRVGDFGTTDCGHTLQATVGSDTVTVNNIPVVRIGDVVMVVEGGVGVTTTGSGNSISG